MRCLLLCVASICSLAVEFPPVKSRGSQPTCQDQLDALQTFVGCWICFYKNQEDYDVLDDFEKCLSEEDPFASCDGDSHSYWPDSSNPIVWANKFVFGQKAYPQAWYYALFQALNKGVFFTPPANNIWSGLNEGQQKKLREWSEGKEYSVLDSTMWGSMIQAVDHLSSCDAETRWKIDVRAYRSYMQASGTDTILVWTNREKEELEKTILYEVELLALSEYASNYAHYPIHIMFMDVRKTQQAYPFKLQPFPMDGHPEEKSCSPIQQKFIERLHNLTSDAGIYLNALNWSLGCQGCIDVNTSQAWDSGRDTEFYRDCFQNIFPKTEVV